MKVADLSGDMLDYWAARANKTQNLFCFNSFNGGPRTRGNLPHYSTDWKDGGPIIDKMPRIRIQQNADGYAVQIFKDENCLIPTYGYGETILIAAMRCWVTAHYGPQVPVEKEQQ